MTSDHDLWGSQMELGQHAFVLPPTRLWLFPAEKKTWIPARIASRSALPNVLPGGGGPGGVPVLIP